MPGTAVTVGDLNHTCITVGGERKLRVSRPRNMSMPKELVGVLLLHFDTSMIIPPGQEGEKVGQVSKCKRWYHLIDVPLKAELSVDDVFSAASRIERQAFDGLAVDVARRNGSHKDRTPHRVHAPQRAGGPIGATA